MARQLKHITLECSACGRRLQMQGAELENRIDDELTFDTVAHVLKRLVCRSCRGRSIRVYDDSSRLLLDTADTTNCRICDDPILLPRIRALPGTTLCARCATEASMQAQPATYPQPPADRAKCPRCRQPTIVRENSKDASYFLGCTGFPACRWTAPFDDPDVV
jgi:ssDNA-binding Zn-finger/Zn-ribbon topoisomerase 1